MWTAARRGYELPGRIRNEKGGGLSIVVSQVSELRPEAPCNYKTVSSPHQLHAHPSANARKDGAPPLRSELLHSNRSYSAAPIWGRRVMPTPDAKQRCSWDGRPSRDFQGWHRQQGRPESSLRSQTDTVAATSEKDVPIGQERHRPPRIRHPTLRKAATILALSGPDDAKATMGGWPRSQSH
jgi:hypothetical protein